ncbi:MAG: TSUP family transporter, partial [Candidatus Omnitrophica bacterium]|nr:TSUP family transporter [Candidatus Omnitrophota bacterium]
LLGLAGGIASGIFGIGGGVVLIPAMVFLFGLTQHQAQGTTLAVLVPPIGLLAALRYYYSGNVKIDMALFVCLGFFVGGFIGASLIQGVPDLVLKRLFGVFMLVIAVRMIVSN